MASEFTQPIKGKRINSYLCYGLCGLHVMVVLSRRLLPWCLRAFRLRILLSAKHTVQHDLAPCLIKRNLQAFILYYHYEAVICIYRFYKVLRRCLSGLQIDKCKWVRCTQEIWIWNHVHCNHPITRVWRRVFNHW